MPRPTDGNEPHFIPRKVDQADEAIIGGPPDDPAVYLPYNFSEICDRGFSQRILGRVLMGTLISHFMDADNIVDPNLSDFVWTSDPDTTGIDIRLNTRWDPRVAGKKPCLTVMRGNAQLLEGSLGDRANPTADGLQAYYGQMQGQFAIRVSAQADGVVERLTDEVFYLLVAQLTFLREHWSFHHLRPSTISQPSPDKIGDHLFHVDIGVEYQYEFTWTRCTGVDPQDLLFQVNVDADKEE